MREIKFRQWHHGRFNYWGFIDGRFDGPETGSGVTIADAANSQQFTGLKDSQEQEIYDGDIISFPYDQWTIVLPIKWETGSWQAIGDGWEERLSDIVFICKIIGNLYENPHLLKEGKK